MRRGSLQAGPLHTLDEGSCCLAGFLRGRIWGERGGPEVELPAKHPRLFESVVTSSSLTIPTGKR